VPSNELEKKRTDSWRRGLSTAIAVEEDKERTDGQGRAVDTRTTWSRHERRAARRADKDERERIKEK
jgi:hypothetical protein